MSLVKAMKVRIKARDGAGRLMEVTLNSGRKFVTPAFFPVINPNLPTITPEDIKDVGFDTLITNAYILWRKKRRGDIHRMLKFDGVVMMDSGAYQRWMYGDIEVTNEEIIEYQNELKPDIGTFLDVVMPHNISEEEAEKGVVETLEGAKVCKELGSEDITWMGTVQGSIHIDLVKMNARGLKKLNYEYFALGSLKIATTEWLFWPQVDYVVTALRILPRDRPVHFWGLGHPATFALFVLLGLDTFDSASYILYARDNRYMTPNGTMRLEEMEEFPHSCPICLRYTPKELMEMDKGKRIRLLALHNLYVIKEEMERVREAIRQESLFELVQERARAHPGLYEAFVYALRKYGKFLETFTPFPKRTGIFMVGSEFKYRPEVKRARKMLRRVQAEKNVKKGPFSFPLALKYTFPFGQSHVPFFQDPEEEPDPVEQVRAILQYQWNIEPPNDLYVEVRRGRPRKVWVGDVYVGMVRPMDGFFVPTVEGAKILCIKEPYVEVDDVAAPFVAKGRSVFARFVIDCSPDIVPNTEVIIVHSGEIIATGKAVLSAREMREFSDHVAVKVRHHLE